jgi:VIT1/CCC1 family predicted Fe2+/Mn2+ transporter
MPELERDELALIYETKGMEPGAARRLADEALKDPERMLAEKVQSELGLGAEGASPLREGWITGTATAVGALLPVFPFFLLRGIPAIVMAFVVAMWRTSWLVRRDRFHRARSHSLRDRHVRRRPGRGLVGYFAGNWVAGWLAN